MACVMIVFNIVEWMAINTVTSGVNKVGFQIQS